MKEDRENYSELHSVLEASAAAPWLRGCSCQDMAHSRMAAGARSLVFIQ